jgi:hypothetical protein
MTIQQLWKNKAFKAKMSKAGKKTMKALWADPAFRRKTVAAIKAKWKDPVYRAMMAKRMKAARKAKAPKKVARAKARDAHA